MVQRVDNIEDAGLGSEDFLAIHILGEFQSQTVSNDTIRTKSSEIWFFQVAGAVPLRYGPFVPHDSEGNELGPINPNSGVQYTQLYDTDGDDILRNDESPWRIYHTALGTRQDQVWIYPRIPEGQNGGGWAWLSAGDPEPTQGDKFGYVNGYETDFDNPSTKLETVTWQQGVRTKHQYGYYNPNDQEAVNPVLSVKGFAYELRPVVEQDAKLNLLADVAKPKSSRDQQVRLVDYSNTALRSFSFSVPDEWRDAENGLEVSRANLPEEIEQQLNTAEKQQRQSSNQPSNVQ